jgi:DNA-binding NtrC family response regulator
MKSLEIRLGDKTSRHRLPSGPCRVGRTDACEIIVDHPSVSRHHVEIRPDGTDFALADLGSTNGLWVDGRRVTTARVGPDQPFVLGSIIAVIRDVVSFDSEDSRTPKSPHAPDPAVERTPEPLREETTGDRTLDLPAEAVGVDPSDDPPAPLANESIVLPLLREGQATFGFEGAFVWAGRGDRGGLRFVAGAGPTQATTQGIERVGEDRISEDGPWGHRLLVGKASPGGGRAVAGFVFESAGRVPDTPAFRAFADLLAALAADAEPVHRPDHSVRIPDVEETVATPYIATTPDSREPLQLALRMARDDMPVMLLGPSGTGKELLARLLHDESDRRSGPFVAINCSAIPADLLEAELFGIERGVATGVDARAGRFLQASGGTLFLDEIGDLPATLQPKLLRALDTSEIVPVGSNDARPIHVRVVSATNADLPHRVEDRRFRADLFYRLAGVRIEIPALADRRDDILPIARQFAREAARKRGKSFLGFEPRFVRALLGHAWPGNVRELRHAIDGAVVLSEGATLEHRHLPADIRAGSDEAIGEVLLSTRDDWRTARGSFARWYFSALLRDHGSNMTEVAKRAGLGRSSLYRLLDELGLR